METLPTGPTASDYINASGDTAVVPTSQIHTATVVFTGGATDRTVSIDASELAVGSRINVVAIWAVGASDGMAVTVRNANGNQLFTFTRAGGEVNALFVCTCTTRGGLRATEQTIPAYPSL